MRSRRLVPTTGPIDRWDGLASVSAIAPYDVDRAVTPSPEDGDLASRDDRSIGQMDLPASQAVYSDARVAHTDIDVRRCLGEVFVKLTTRLDYLKALAKSQAVERAPS